MTGIFELIVSSLNIASNITSLIKKTNYNDEVLANERLIGTLDDIERRLIYIESMIISLPNVKNESRIIEKYANLIEILQNNNYYTKHLEFIQTDYGTWKIISKKSKSTVLRDPEGEYM